MDPNLCADFWTIERVAVETPAVEVDIVEEEVESQTVEAKVEAAQAQSTDEARSTSADAEPYMFNSDSDND